MRSLSAKFFICKVEIETYEEGLAKKVTNQYAVDAISFGEAEQRITEHLSPYCDGEMDIKDIKIANFGEVYFTDDDADEKFFTAKLDFITVDERSGKEKRLPKYFLYQSSSLDEAVKAVNESMKGTLIDFDKTEVKDSKIVEVIEYNGNEERSA